jgi:hypothetical protein
MPKQEEANGRERGRRGSTCLHRVSSQPYLLACGTRHGQWALSSGEGEIWQRGFDGRRQAAEGGASVQGCNEILCASYIEGGMG